MTHVNCGPRCTQPAQPTDSQLSWQDRATVAVLALFVIVGLVCLALGQPIDGIG
jgi:hypothetical protein